jgi:arginine-tRNA-protein transferase
MSAELKKLKVFTTFPHPCSYLEGKTATTLFVDPRQPIDRGTYTALSQMGFRRSGDHIYRPACSRCQACLSARVIVDRFVWTKNFNRIVKKNRDIVTQIDTSIDDDEAYTLYARYIQERHQDGDMFPPDPEQFRSFLATQNEATFYVRFRYQNQLIGVSVCDLLNDGISAIYTYFDPALAQRSLGTYAILWQILEAGKLGLDYVYLGYWIEQCQKMNYKSRFQPLELLENGIWTDKYSPQGQ